MKMMTMSHWQLLKGRNKVEYSSINKPGPGPVALEVKEHSLADTGFQ